MSCYDGEDALYYIESAEYDGIILDVMIPKINGFEVLKIIRERKIQAPVLMLTAKDSDEDIIDGLDKDAKALRKMLCKQYLTTFDKVKITGISLIKSVNNNYWLLPQDRIRQC